jgi:hypothetical protein
MHACLALVVYAGTQHYEADIRSLTVTSEEPFSLGDTVCHLIRISDPASPTRAKLIWQRRGSTAYAIRADVLPGTDLVVTATAQGGFSDVFVVHTPAAATDPRLAGLLKARITASSDLRMRTDAVGDFFAAAPDGHSVFTAPRPSHGTDSATTQAASRSIHNTLIPTNTRAATVASTVSGPGAQRRPGRAHGRLSCRAQPPSR